AEAAVEGDAVADGPVGLDVLHPGIHGEAHGDVVVLAAAHVQVFDPGVFGAVGDGVAGELRGVGGVEADVQGRGEGDGVTADGGDLEHLADRAVVAGEPAAARAARRDRRLLAPIDVRVVGQLLQPDGLSHVE